MKYYFNESQFMELWGMYSSAGPDSERKKLWNSLIRDEFKLEYDELTGQFSHTNLKQGYWGYIIGEEKHINWFLLQFSTISAKIHDYTY